MAVLKLLRNQTLYATHEAALTAIDQMADNLHDGELWVATYGTSPNAKSILALKRTDGLTIFDNETSSDAITAVINALDATVKDGLDSVDDTQVAEGKHVGVKVVETDGKLVSISVVEDDIASAALLGTKNDSKENETAFGYIKKESADRTAAIEALDYTDSAVAKQFVTSVSETNGIISVSRGEVTSADKTVKLNGSADGNIDLAVNVDGTTIVKDNTNGTLSVASSALTQYVGDKAINVSGVNASNQKTISLVIPNTEKVLSQDADGLKTTIVLKSVTPTDATVREEYELQGVNGQKLGTDTIKIYKDQTLKDASFANQILTLTYILDNGTEKAVPIDMSSLVLETEVENGIQAVDHKLSIKLDDTGDDTGTGKFLTVGANGLKLDGVSNAIKNAINALNVEHSTATDGATFITTEISETNGIVSNKGVSVVYGNYATENQTNGIAKTVDTKTYVDTVVANKNVEAEGDFYVDAIASNNKIIVSTSVDDLQFTQGSDNTPSTLTCAPDTLIDGSDAANKVSQFVNARIGEEIAKLDSVVTSSTGQNVDVQVRQVDGKITSVDIITDATASMSALFDEITARKAVDGQNGQIYAANNSSNYIKNATSLNDADVKLDAALKTADDAMLTGVTGSDAITVYAKTNKNQTISLKLDTATKPAGFTNADNVLSVTSDGLYLSSIIDCGTY